LKLKLHLNFEIFPNSHGFEVYLSDCDISIICLTFKYPQTGSVLKTVFGRYFRMTSDL